MTIKRRIDIYNRQNGCLKLTPRQRRRVAKHQRRLLGH